MLSGVGSRARVLVASFAGLLALCGALLLVSDSSASRAAASRAPVAPSNEATPSAGPGRGARPEPDTEPRSPARAEATGPETASAESSAASAPAVLSGRVVDERGAGVERVRVLLSVPDLWQLEALSREDGRFSFHAPSVLEPGAEGVVTVDERALGPGLLPPLQRVVQDLHDPTAVPGFFVPRVSLPFAGELVVRMFRPASVQGRALSGELEPLSGDRVRLSSVSPELAELSYEVAVAPDGSFSFPYAWPGEYVVSLQPADPVRRSTGVPPPERIVVLEGATTRVGELVLGAGPLTVRGSVVDQQGQPFAGVFVIAYHVEVDGAARVRAASALTDAGGEFTFEGLAASPVRLIAGPPEFEAAEQVADGPLTVELDLRGRTGSVDLEPIRGLRPSRYRLAGRVVLEPAWARANGVRLDDVSLRIEGEVQDQRFDPRPDLERTATHEGRFEWQCLAPAPPLTLRVQVAGALEPRTYDLHPVDGATDELVIWLP